MQSAVIISFSLNDNNNYPLPVTTGKDFNKNFRYGSLCPLKLAGWGGSWVPAMQS